jgi:hypothetical protein
LIAEDGPEIVPFGGRGSEFGLLQQWLDDAQAPPRFILAAPGGRGKSALLVHWVARLQADGQAGAGESQWNIAFVPISMRFGTHLPQVFYEAIAARLAEILGGTIDPPQTDPEAYYQDKCRALLNEAIQRKMRILVAVDGVDEALGGRFDASWFPRGPGPLLRLLVTARLQVGDQDASAWAARLGWTREVRTKPHDLPVLSLEGVKDLLRNVGAPVDVLASQPD